MPSSYTFPEFRNLRETYCLLHYSCHSLYCDNGYCLYPYYPMPGLQAVAIVMSRYETQGFLKISGWLSPTIIYLYYGLRNGLWVKGNGILSHDGIMGVQWFAKFEGIWKLQSNSSCCCAAPFLHIRLYEVQHCKICPPKPNHISVWKIECALCVPLCANSSTDGKSRNFEIQVIAIWPISGIGESSRIEFELPT